MEKTDKEEQKKVKEVLPVRRELKGHLADCGPAP